MKRIIKGFTLAELLIVIAIVAVLAAIAIPIYYNQLNKAELAVDMANERTLGSYAAVLRQTGSLTFGDVTITTGTGAGQPAFYFFLDDGTLSADYLNPGTGGIPQLIIPENAYRARGTDEKHKKGSYLFLVVEGRTGEDVRIVWVDEKTI